MQFKFLLMEINVGFFYGVQGIQMVCLHGVHAGENNYGWRDYGNGIIKGFVLHGVHGGEKYYGGQI